MASEGACPFCAPGQPTCVTLLATCAPCNTLCIATRVLVPNGATLAVASALSPSPEQPASPRALHRTPLAPCAELPWWGTLC